jgi:hypothetical protein
MRPAAQRALSSSARSSQTTVIASEAKQTTHPPSRDFRLAYDLGDVDCFPSLAMTEAKNASNRMPPTGNTISLCKFTQSVVIVTHSLARQPHLLVMAWVGANDLQRPVASFGKQERIARLQLQAGEDF